MKKIFIKIRFFIRELIGLYRLIKAKIDYKSKNSPVYYSDYSKNSIKRFKDESFESFFMRIEEIRNNNSDESIISKNVSSSLKYFSTAAELIPFLKNTCNLKKNTKVLDYGSGGLRCGFGLLDYLEAESYSCADITDNFFNEAISNSFLLATLFDKKKGVFYIIDKDDIPKRYYDLVISTYVVPHIPEIKLSEYFCNIEKYLNNEGIFYFDFMSSPICLKQNLTTFTYPYRLIAKKLNDSGFRILNTYGSSIVAKKID